MIILYNSIKLQMFHNKDEIIISQLIGASNLFIMRPLTYYIVTQVTLSAIIGYLVVSMLINSFNNISSILSVLGGQIVIIPLSTVQIMQLFTILIIFSIFATSITVQFILKKHHSI